MNNATVDDVELERDDVSGGDTEVDTNEDGESEMELTFNLEPELDVFARSDSYNNVATASPRASNVCELPDEVIVCVTRFLRLHDVMSLLETSRRFNRLCSNKDIWHHLYSYYEAQLGPMFDGKKSERGIRGEERGERSEEIIMY